MLAKNVLITPAPYILWALFVSAALYGAFVVDPHVFGFTTLALAWLTAGVSLVGLATCMFSKRPIRRDRVIIIAALALAAAVLVKALCTLGAFNWA